ncbi:dystroglycan-like [Dorcoceras hygrometricum]|uniref:Dystroglycan-like n=1 Tax=Dorcoceras hygrometricum TaxID=472368 RepID=A0A2Z7CRY0_9LAMI|nr:dystroglycan-like [Dorcoceras hygrometricum]
MASSYYNNTLHVNFESILAMDDPGMVSMFQALMASGLEGFLGCPAVIYEAALVDFFENSSVRDGVVVSTVHGITVEISEQLFAETFELPVEGSKQAKGYSVQISLLLENVPNLELGESSELSSSKILTDKTIHRYIVLNEKVGAEEVAAAPQVKKAPKRQAASKKRPAAAAVGEPVLKKKRTMKKKSVSSQENLEIVVVAQEAVPIQMIAQIPAAPAADETTEQPAVAGETSVQEPAAEHMDEQLEEPTADEEIVVENITEPAQVLAETAHVEADEEDHGVGTSGVGDQTAETSDREKHWFDLPYEDIIAQMDAERPLVTASDTDEEMETIDAGTGVGDQQLQSFVAADSRTAAAADYFVQTLEEVEMIFIRYSLFSRLGTADIRDFVSTIAMDRTILRNDSPHSASDSPLQFISNDISMADDTTRFSNSLADIQTLLSERIGDSHNDVLSRLHTFDKGLRDALLQQGEDLRKLIQNVQQDGRNLDDVQTLRFNEFRKGFLAHGAADSMDFRKGEVSSSRPQKPPDDQNRGSGNAGGGGDNVRTANIVDRYSGPMSREGHSKGRRGGRRSSGSRSGSSKRKHPSSAGGRFRRSFEDWLG